MTKRAWTAYSQASQHYFDVYQELDFTKMHKAFLRFLPAKGSLCLDVGAGSGRDAASLARRGYQVTAVEPSQGLRSLAESHHGSSSITWIDDKLPRLDKVKSLPDRYKFILLSAVWMHIPLRNRLASLRTLRSLLAPDGYIAITLRLGIPSSDRVMYPVSVDELLQHAEKVGLSPVYVGRKTKDSMSRNDVEWQKVVLQATPIDKKASRTSTAV
ncbi:methyltransferase family protein [Microvirgula sp. AG722]|uniref:class I SAM-dependent methyltransferase n=1 Tax=Microvirgula sp. AG722 TaxID=2183901 RepID=UPI000DC283FB|nr:class I SAM-dependent methyltransferase [Microvirgula sp. AG722]RAS14253.1 methyltransferase family protein [Microvirgula sp. AG722]